MTSDGRNMPPYVSVKYMYIFSFLISFMLSIEIKNNLLGTISPTSFLLGRACNKTEKNHYEVQINSLMFFEHYTFIWEWTSLMISLCYFKLSIDLPKIHTFNSSGTLFIRRFCLCLAKPYSFIRWTSFWNNFVHVYL